MTDTMTTETPVTLTVDGRTESRSSLTIDGNATVLDHACDACTAPGSRPRPCAGPPT